MTRTLSLASLLITLPLGAAAQVPAVSPTFPNVPQTAGALLSGLNAPQQGRTALIAYHNGILFTIPESPSSQPGADLRVRTWDISVPANPQVTQTLEVTPQPINAHGYLKSGDYLILGSNWPPGGEWSFAYTPGPARVTRGPWPDLLYIGTRGALFQPWFVDPTYWTYNPVAGDAVIELRGVPLATWDHLGLTGVIGHPFLLGDLLIFASDQSRTGVATYDVSDPTNPVLLDVLTAGGPGGYWPELWGGDGKLYIVFPYRELGNGIRVVDATDPSDLRLVADTPLPGAEAMYIQFQDEFGFTGDHKVDMRTFASVLDLDGRNVTRTNDGGTGIDTSQFALPLGNLLLTGGVGPNEGMAIWAHQSEPDLRGPAVGYHIPRDGRVNYPVGAPISLLIHEELESFTIINGVSFIVRPIGGMPVPGQLTLAFDDVLTFTPDLPLQADTTYEVVLPDGGIKDAAGNGITGYRFTFSTGNAVGGNRAPMVTSFVATPYPAAPGTLVSLTATVSDPDGDPLELRFDFGDGGPKTPWTPAATIDHAYAAPAHYQPTVQVRDPSLTVASAAVTVTVTAPPPSPAPTHSAPILCASGVRTVYTVAPDSDRLSAIDADSLSLEWDVPVCADPRSVARSAAGELWVSCHDDDRLWVLDRDGRFTDEILLGCGAAPAGLAISADGSSAYVALHGSGAIARFDTATRAETGRLALGPRPRAIALSSDGTRALVTRQLSPRDHAEVWDVDAAAMTLTATRRLAKAGGSENFDGTASGRGTANYLNGIVIAPSGERAWIAANKPNVERGLFFFDDLDQDNAVRNQVLQLDLVSGRAGRALDLDNSDSSSAAAYSPLGDYLFVTLQGNDEVMVLDALRVDSSSGLGAVVTRLRTGAAPQGVCVDPVTRRTFVHNFLGRSVSVLETDAFLRTGAKSVASVEIATTTLERLAPDVLLGKRLFYHASDRRMSAEGYMSCASCHLDGDSDGRVWDFTGRGEGFRNTTSLRGRAGMAQGNVHWSANFDEIQDFENDIRGAFGGRGFLSDADFAATMAPLGPPKAGLNADLDALAAYVSSLSARTIPRSPFRNPDGTRTAAAVRGEAVFASNGCATCHAGAAYTDSTPGAATLHDVGTLRTSSGGRLGGPLAGIDTPTLLGVWDTEPYFHDGSAYALNEVFRVAGGTILPAETGTVSGGAYVTDQYTELNNDDTLHGRAYVNLENGRLTFANVDGGAGGVGDLEIRYNAAWPTGLDVIVNGVARAVLPVVQANDPQWRQTIWARLRVEDIALTAGTTNTIELANGSIGVDDITVTTADLRALAAPHRRILATGGGDEADLIAFLRELDGHGDPEFGGLCGDGRDNDGDGDADCDDADCAGGAACTGVAINRSLGASATLPTVYRASCATADLTLCRDGWRPTTGTTLTLAGEVAPGPPSLWLYQHSSPVTLRIVRAGADLALSW